MAQDPFRLRQGDCREVMRAELAADSVDAIVTDPPYGLSFMGKAWDHGVPGVEFWTEALRVAKPGAHLLAFGGTRTFHRLTCAIEDAGWEVRDCISWLYGSGFPKSLDVSKAIDKAAGVFGDRPIVGYGTNGMGRLNQANAAAGYRPDAYGDGRDGVPVTAPASEAAQQWRGYGTNLKPAWEPVILARKPLVGTVAANVLEHGTGALNIDGCRIAFAPGEVSPTEEKREAARRSGNVPISGRSARESQAAGRMERRGSPETFLAYRPSEALGRWPANVVLDEEAAALLDAQTGERGGGYGVRGGSFDRVAFGACLGKETGMEVGYGDSGGASRFFYCAKASTAEREAGCEGLRAEGKERANIHATVKPVDLMRWLCRLVTPPGGLVLDPFMGSGTTGVAALAEGLRFVGIELDADYLEIAKARIEHQARQPFQLPLL